jgi:hypothetical protein
MFPILPNQSGLRPANQSNCQNITMYIRMINKPAAQQQYQANKVLTQCHLFAPRLPRNTPSVATHTYQLIYIYSIPITQQPCTYQANIK